MRKNNSYPKIKEAALRQTLEYAKKSGSTENHIVIFDRDSQTDWRDKIFTEEIDYEGEAFKIWCV